MSKIATIDPVAPDSDLIHHAVGILRQGGMVVVPTRHLYGLGVDALNPQAVAQVFAAKQRPLHQPLLIMVASQADVGNYACDLDDRTMALMDTFWPGKVTIVLKARPILPTALTGGSERIGIRVPGHPVCQEIVRALAGPLTATSANLSGQPGCRRIQDLHPDIIAAVDFVLDAGPLKPGIGSTVVDIRASDVQVLREGAVAAVAIRNAVERLALPP